jgi:hypothetical protein
MDRADALSATSRQPERIRRAAASSEPNGRVTRVQTNANNKPAGPARLLFMKVRKFAS